jgi:hypothetical protein
MAIEVNRLYLFGSLTHKEDATTALETTEQCISTPILKRTDGF